MTYSARSIPHAILLFLASVTVIFSMSVAADTDKTETPGIVDAELGNDTGQISFWVKPDWNGNDGKRHVLLCVGDPEINGMLVEKSVQNMLRFVMAGDSKVSAARFAVPHWKSGEWHMVTVRWNRKKNNTGTIALLLDEHLPGIGGPEPVHGVYITGKGFMDQQSMADKRIHVGEDSSRTVIGELIFHPKSTDVYADYYKTAPYESISIDYAPNYARTDKRVIAGYPKQFGLRGVIRGEKRQLTDFTRRYGCWGIRDAKPLINWQSSDPQVATVDTNGLVAGVAPGSCTLTANFRGMKATYPLEVISSNLTDLTIIQLSRKPLYHKNARKTDPAPGDPVTITAVIGNYGFKDSKAGIPVRFELIPDTNANFILDDDEQPIFTQSQVLNTVLAPKEHTNIVFAFDCPEEPCWIRVTIVPEQEELCLPNNSRWHLTTAHPARIKISQKEQIDKFYDERKINLVGSFCHYDYAQAQFDCFDWMLRNAIYPETSPVGIQSSFYIEVIAVSDKKGDEGDQLYNWAEFYTGGLHVHSEHILMAQNSGALHEGGHNLFSLPDLYGYYIKENLIRDETGGLYRTQSVIPKFSLAPVPEGEGYYDSFMNHCHLWLHPANAGKVQYYRNTRPRYFWWGQSRLMATWRNILDFYDVNDQPLTNAAVYVYHGTDGGHALYDRSKFVGHTDQFGQYIFPNRADEDWDDPATDEFDGGLNAWTPFAQGYRGADDRWRQVPFTPNVIETEGILLVKVVANRRTEFFWVTDLDFHCAFFRNGYGPIGRIPIYTSLVSPEQPEPLKRQKVVKNESRTNLKPVAKLHAPETAAPGDTITVDASESMDTEGNELTIYRWKFKGASPEEKGKDWMYSSEKKVTVTVPEEFEAVEVSLQVNDGLRWSEEETVRIKPETTDETD